MKRLATIYTFSILAVACGAESPIAPEHVPQAAVPNPSTSPSTSVSQNILAYKLAGIISDASGSPMLRQSVMGSDMSYEDLMEDPRFQNLYEAKVTGEESVLERGCWVLQATAKPGMNPAYHSRKLWVDKERFLVLKEERFATSGRLLKTAEVTKVSQVQQRWIAERALFKDALKNDGGTEFVVGSVEFNAKIPDTVFSQASLRK